MLVIVSAALPVFVSVEICAALVEPTAPDPKSRLVGLKATPGAVARPVPLRPRLCGLPDASSEIVTDADRGPEPPGVNVTLMEHVALTARVAGLSGQSLSCAKSAAFVPATTIAEIVSGAVPELRSVALCDGLVLPIVCPANVRLGGVSVTAGAVPVPVSPAVCGLPLALSVIDTLADRLAVALGVNVTDTVHEALTASVAGAIGQLFDCAKSAAFVPVIAMPLIESGADPELVTEIVCGAAVVPARCEPKPRLVGASVVPAAVVPVPVSPSVCGLPVPLSVIWTDAVRVPDADGVNVTVTVQVALAASVAGEIGRVFVCA